MLRETLRSVVAAITAALVLLIWPLHAQPSETEVRALSQVGRAAFLAARSPSE